MTEKIFYQTPYCRSFTAEVISCEKQNGKYRAVLSRTAFYPEGGGQPCDKGTLAGLDVLDVQEKGGEILHDLNAPLLPGQIVQGEIDWEFRFSLMQQHSGEHIFSGIAHQLFGCENVGFHMSRDFITVDFDRPLTEDEIFRTENLANQRIFQNLPITAAFFSQQEAKHIDYRFKKEIQGPIRIVQIPDTDNCACCGLHTRNTGEIGVILAENFQNYKGGVRIFLKIGNQALEDYRRKNQTVHRTAAFLSVKNADLQTAVQKLSEKTEQLKKEKLLAEEQYFTLLAEGQKDARIPCLIRPELSADQTRTLAEILRKTTQKNTCAALSGSPGDIRYAIVSQTDASVLSRELNQTFSGRGGGKKNLCCGTLSQGSYEEIERRIFTFET